MRRVVPVTLFVLAAAACASDEPAECMDGELLESETPLPAEIADIFERNCWICHTDPPAGFAPFPLLTWEDVQRPHRMNDLAPRYLEIAERIRNDVMPMPPLPPPDLADAEKADWPRLSETEKQTIEAWVADCAPPGP